MGITMAFCILRGKVLLKVFSSADEDYYYSRLYISDDLKNVKVDGWSISLKKYRGKEGGKIFCNHTFVYFGGIVHKKQVFELENGILAILYPDMDYFDYDTFDLVQTACFYPLAKYKVTSAKAKKYEPNLKKLGPLYEKDKLVRKAAKQLYEQFNVTL